MTHGTVGVAVEEVVEAQVEDAQSRERRVVGAPEHVAVLPARGGHHLGHGRECPSTDGGRRRGVPEVGSFAAVGAGGRIGSSSSSSSRSPGASDARTTSSSVAAGTPTPASAPADWREAMSRTTSATERKPCTRRPRSSRRRARRGRVWRRVCAAPRRRVRRIGPRGRPPGRAPGGHGRRGSRDAPRASEGVSGAGAGVRSGRRGELVDVGPGSFGRRLLLLGRGLAAESLALEELADGDAREDVAKARG